LTSAAGGGFVGSSIGIAALGTAISGTLPLAVIFGVGGYALSKIVFKCPHCGKIFRS
jgi:hypothetical protein